MKIVYFILLFYLTFVSDVFSQSIVIEPAPANGIMMDIKNAGTGLPSTNYALTIPKVNVLPASPREGMLVFYAGRLQYYNGSTWIVNGSSESIPSKTIVLSPVQQNLNLINAGYSQKGVTNLSYNPTSLGSFGWVKALSTVNSPNRTYHAAVWTGNRMLIWGGFVEPSWLNTGSIYNLETNTWNDIAPSFLSGRVHFGFAWTGSVFLVWGGYINSTFKNDGASYNVTNNTWTTLSAANSPSARGNFSSVWTGERMIIWGGYTSSSTVAGDGKMYNPGNNTWSDMSTTNAPSARVNASAVWTGSKMIIWGGGSLYGVALNTGGIYDPVTDTWTTISVNGAPPNGSIYHSAIWTGSRMIVFGGRNNQGVTTNTFYLYDPVENAWSVGSPTNIPGPRRDHKAAWVNNKMVIFGGFYGEELNDGGIYDPSTNTWSDEKIVLPGMPSLNHTFLKVDKDVILFGEQGGYLLKGDFKNTESRLMYLFEKN